jgi:hypothetical protein
MRQLGIQLSGLIPPHLFACPKPEPGIPKPIWYDLFMFNGLRWEVVARLVDIGGIIGCLKVLFFYGWPSRN